MRDEKEILDEIEKSVSWIIRVGKKGGFKDRQLLDLAMWDNVESLCWVLGKESIEYWNRICSEVPSLGEVTPKEE